MSSGEENASQGSSLSLDLQLSQDTVNQVLSAVGMSSGSDGNRFIEMFRSELTEEDLEEELGPPVTGASSISISRAIVRTNSNVMPMWGGGPTSLSQGSAFNSSQPPPFSSFNHLPATSAAGVGVSSSIANHTPTPSPHQAAISPHEPSSSTNFPFDTESPLAASTQRLLTPPPSTSLHPTQSEAYSTVTPTIRPNIPSNLPMAGEYKFELSFAPDKKKTKNASITYSSETQRAYIKQGLVVPFHFKLSKSPPDESFIRAMAIYKAPEMIAESLICCPNHVDDQKKAGKLFPYHFVRPQDKDTVSRFCEDLNTKRLSVITPFEHLQKKSSNSYTALYLFPCFTSQLPKCGQNVQLIFTLECMQEVLGRCTVDIRVCASPGRDRDVDEMRARGEDTSSTPDASNKPPPPSTRRGRKRGARSTQEEVVQCTVPPKQVCHGLSGRKVDYTIHTFPEIIPFIEVCVKMMEQVYNVPVDIDTPAVVNDRGQPSQPSFTSVESWLDHLELLRYANLLKKHGVTELFQVTGITEEELKRWGMKSVAHRQKFLEGKDKIKIKSEDEEMESTPGDASGSPPLFCSQEETASSSGSGPPGSGPPTSSAAMTSDGPPRLSHLPSAFPALPPSSSSSQPRPPATLASQQSFPGGSQSSQLSIGSTQPFVSSSMFEVVQIQLRKKFNQQH